MRRLLAGSSVAHRVIHKLSIPLENACDPQGFVISKLIRFLHAGQQEQYGEPCVCVWYECNPDFPRAERWEFRMFLTGDEVPTEDWSHIHTFFSDGAATYVGHVYARRIIYADKKEIG